MYKLLTCLFREMVGLCNALQVVGWGADGVIIGSAIVKLLGTASSSEEGLAAVKAFAQSIRSAV